MSLVEALIVVSEKAANIARNCRHNRHLFELLVQRKEDAESNPRFVQDFKTLADVLIQETVKHDVGCEFPDLKDCIKGEESNTFSNTLGETISVEVQSNSEETAKLLETVLSGDAEAARLLAEEVHKEVSLEQVNTSKEGIHHNFDCKDLGVWIDPIDSTAEYIEGKEKECEGGIYASGLRCVTVLIGAYNRQTGIPVLGVVNQPFYEQLNGQWRGQCHWGYTNSSAFSSISERPSPKKIPVVCLSISEDEAIKGKLRAAGFALMEAAGAGYKILTVVTGHADAYVLSKGTTFKWDTCGPQAILRSLGGDVLKFDDALEGSFKGLDYGDGSCSSLGSKIDKYCNDGGILAYRDRGMCEKIVQALNL